LPEIRNPNQGGGGGSQDNRSFLIMMIVMIGVIFGLQYWRAQHNNQTAPPNQTPPSQTTGSHAAGSQAQSASAPASAPGTPAAKSSTPAVPTVQAAAESSTVVENELYRITFSNRGGQVTSWILKKYTDTTGHPLNIVDEDASRLYGYPLSLYTYDAGLTKQLTDALYVPSANGAPLTGDARVTAPATLSFNYSAGDLTVRKTFTFGADYVIHADTVVLRNGAPVRALISWPSGFGDLDTASAYAQAQIDTGSSGHIDHTAFKKVGGGATLNGPYDFAGVSDQYFAAVFLPDQPQDATMVTLHDQIDVNKVKRNERTGAAAPTDKVAMVPLLGAGVGALSGHNQERLFVGPKALDVLKSIHPNGGGSLEPMLDFGFFGFIGKYLFLGLHAVHSWLPHTGTGSHNYSWGWAIVLFTVLIYAVLMPLRVQGMKSAVKMQRIQPQIDAIKAKYKNPKATDPKTGEMNAEIMAYQKEQGVSMFGGCIPSLIQLPLLFAFFTMMTRVVELRQAHFFWLPDLSLPDPYHILPITMVITSFLAQFYTPSPGVDPKQQKMMAFFMPLVSGYWTWNYASGLALYWNIGNLVMVGQQLVMNRTSLGREMREIAAKRARRKSDVAKPGAKAIAKTGSAKTIQGRR
jgi:YidC/Oxa1 family membrane protein insertase